MSGVNVAEMAATEVSERLKEPNPPRLLDVREQDEHDYCRIEGAELFPLSEIEVWSGELDPHGEYIVYCHTGRRSWQVCAYLMNQGFTNVANLSGGIHAWSMFVDPNVPRY